MKPARGLCCGIAAAVAIALGAAPHPAGAQTTVRMWTFLNDTGTSPREQTLARLIESFEAANPDIDVQVEQQVWDQMTPKFFAAHGAGTAPDVIWVIMDQYPVAVELGALANLYDLFIKDWPEEQRAAIADTYWDYGSYGDDEHYMIAHSRNYFGVMYRDDFMREAGIDPASIATWDDMIAAAKQLTRKGDGGERWGFGQQFGLEKADPSPVLYWILEGEGHAFNEDCTANWANESGAKALADSVSYVTELGITPEAALNYSVEDLYDQLAAGRVAIITGAGVRMPRMQAAINDRDVRFMQFPSDEPGRPLPAAASGWAVGVWSGSENVEAAAKWLEYMSSPEADKLWVEIGGQVPLYSSTIEAMPEFFADPGHDYLAVASEGFKTAWLPRKGCDVGGLRQDLNTAAQEVLLHGKEPMQALEDAEVRFNSRHGY